ncbi:MAG: hypothetical protein LBH20_06455 [Treponema sp.]|jgi:hypothetical protein|nr:hypothetical protein [Treponema sp.]
MGYSNEIIQVKNGFLIRNYNALKLCFIYILYILFTLFFCFPIIYSIIFGILDKDLIHYLKNVIPSLILYLIFVVPIINFSKKIIINLNEKKIVFNYRLIPFVKTKIIYIEEIDEISINYLTENQKFHVYKMKEKIYCVDLIDKNKYSYTIYQSKVYDEKIKEFANKFGIIINKNVDNDNIKENKYIYIKNII